MENKTTQQDINRIVWKACDTFRGVIDPSQYKDYVLTMLFIKYVSDVYKSKYNEYLIRYEKDKERAARDMKRERFDVPEISSFDYLYEHRNENNIGELINIALASLEEANREKMSSEDIDHIVNTYRKFTANELNAGVVEDKYAYIATVEEIEENDYNLNIPRYVDTFEEEAEIDIQAVQQEIDSLEKELVAVQAKMRVFKRAWVLIVHELHELTRKRISENSCNLWTKK